MASVQASSSAAKPSRKEHLEAGKKRLEQFSKKKAAKKATAVAEQAKPAPPPPGPTLNAASFGDGLSPDVEPNTASTSSVYENGPTSSSSGAVYSSVGIGNINPQQDTVSDGESKFYGNLSFSDLVNGHHENWRADVAESEVPEAFYYAQKALLHPSAPYF